MLKSFLFYVGSNHEVVTVVDCSRDSGWGHVVMRIDLFAGKVSGGFFPNDRLWLPAFADLIEEGHVMELS